MGAKVKRDAYSGVESTATQLLSPAAGGGAPISTELKPPITDAMDPDCCREPPSDVLYQWMVYALPGFGKSIVVTDSPIVPT